MSDSVDVAVGNDLRNISAPVLKTIVASGTTYTPTANQTVILGADATITIGGQSINLLQGSPLIMLKSVTYTFGASTQLGIS